MAEAAPATEALGQTAATTADTGTRVGNVADADGAPTRRPPDSSGAGHVDIIDAVRGLAAVLVAGFHSLGPNWIGFSASWALHKGEVSLSSLLALTAWVFAAPFKFGSIGVPILFVVSGYVIHRRAAYQLANGSLAFEPSHFLLRRFVRIYPTLLAAIVVTGLCDHVTRRLLGQAVLGDSTLGDTGSWWALLVNVASLQGALGPPYGSNVALWSLAYEVQFYAVYPLMLLLRRRIGATAMLLAALAISVLGYVVLARRGIGAFPTYFVSWWLGAYLADREAAATALPSWWPVLPCLFIPAGCWLSLSQRPFLMFMAWAAGVAPILAWLVGLRSPLAGRRTALHEAGQFSYSMYAIHMPVIALANALLLAGHPSDSLLWSLAMAAVIGLASYALFLAVERPSIRMLAKLPR